MIKIALKKINKDMELPKYATNGSAAIDLCASIIAPAELTPGNTIFIPSGIAIHINNSLLCGMIIPRSGLGAKKGLLISNGVGLIDSDYTGEIMLSLWNRSDKPIIIQPYQRVAQMIFVPIVHVEFYTADSLEHTDRGNSGFGSTGE